MSAKMAGALLLFVACAVRPGLAAPKEVSEQHPLVRDAKGDAQAVLDMLLPAATHLLEKNGEMFPIGGAMLRDGTVAAVAIAMDSEHPPSQAVIDALNAALHKDASTKHYRATGIAVDVRTIPPGESAKTDAIEVRLEHESGYSTVLVCPYRRNGGKLSFGKTFAVKGTHEVFPAR